MQSKRIRDILDMLDAAELQALLNDVEHGSTKLRRLVKHKLEQKDLRHREICATCSASINPYNVNTYTLAFGPADFRKKATFCGLDCLETFLESIKELKRG